LIFFVLITWETCSSCGLAQGSGTYPVPWIQEIKLPDHYTDIPNCSFYLDRFGHLFLGKDNGLTIISENGSIHRHMNGPVYVTGNGSDTVLYACQDNIGLLFPDGNGKYRDQTYRDRIPRAYREFVPSQLIHADGSFFMNADKGIYRFDGSVFKVFPFPEQETRLLMAGSTLLLKVEGEAILAWTGEGFFATDVMDGDSLGFMLDLLDERPDLRLVNFISREEMVVVRQKDGIMIMDARGKVLNIPGNRHGLPDQDVRQATICEGDELWILGGHSLHLINHPSPLFILELDPDVTGRIFTSVVTGKQMLLGTYHGIYLAAYDQDIHGPWTVRSISDEAEGSFHLISSSDSMVFAAGSKQLVAIRGMSAQILARGNYTGLHEVSPTLLLVSGEKGITRFEKTDQEWTSTPVDPALSYAYSFVKHHEQVFMICNNRAFRFSKDLDEAIPIPFNRDEILYKLITVEQDLYLVTDQHVYRYEDMGDRFVFLTDEHRTTMLSSSDIALPDEDSGLWMVRHLGKYDSRVTHSRFLSDQDMGEWYYPVLQDLGEIISLDLRDSVLYLTGMDKIVLFDLSVLKSSTRSFQVRIEPGPEPASPRSLAFHLAGLEFQSVPEPLFRFRMIPEEEEWSAWSNSREVSIERLRPGQYTFLAQAKDLYGRISVPAAHDFTIKAPFYWRWYAIIVYGVFLLILLFLIRKWRLLSYQQAESRISERMQTKLDSLAEEKEKSDKLVAEMLPEKTAAQLKSVGKAKWDKYERATVLFSDIQGFTKIAEEMNPEALIDELDKFFFHFDSVVEKYNIEKIKTIGDAYMAAGGIPEKNSTNPVEVVLAALEMQAYMQQLKSTKADIWDLRIGIHTGPVIAGVVGHKKVSYDIWGDTVNTASRMESSGMPGKVNISGITYGMVKEYFICEYRGKLPVKYKGNIDMYFVNGLRPELAVDLKGIPNKRFYTKLQLLRLGDLEERVFESILTGLPSSLHFHRIEYARKVYNQSFLLCRSEEIEQDERLLVRTAALMLYTGLTQAYHNYENRSAVIAREILPNFHYSEVQIDQVCNLILATKQPFQPNNQLEKILIDAKMEYIGHPDFPEQLQRIYREIKETGSSMNGQQFKKLQLEFLYTFDFFTLAAQRLREVSREDQIEKLEQERWI
jgi:adenylate cyclase